MAAAHRPKAAAKPKPDGAICPIDWPGGWPEDGNHAGCVHGEWHR